MPAHQCCWHSDKTLFSGETYGNRCCHCNATAFGPFVPGDAGACARNNPRAANDQLAREAAWWSLQPPLDGWVDAEAVTPQKKRGE